MRHSRRLARAYLRAVQAATSTILAGFALLAATPVAAGEIDGAPGDAVARIKRITVAGVARTYELVRPEGFGADAGPRPLVLMLHGGGGSARQLREHAAFDAQASAHGFVVAYPNGIARGWEVPGPPPDTRRSQEGDIVFLLAIVDRLAAEGIADARQVFVAGISNGGRMALNLACHHAARLRGIAVVAASLPEEAPCRADAPVAVLLIHGTDDALTPMAGGEVRVGRSRRGRLIGVPRTLAYWAAVNGCGPAATSELPVREADDPTRASRMTYAGCRAPLEAIVIRGGGHTWPGASVQPLLARLVGPTSRQLEASTEIAAFFARASAQR